MGLEKLYILLNKPVGYTSTRFDKFAKHTVLELVSSIKAYLYPVGRLDVDTSGLLLLTNDGDFAQMLTHPSREIEKVYVAEMHGLVIPEKLNKLATGVMLDDGMTAPAKVQLISYSQETNTSTVEVTIHEGRKRQVRRMFDAVGHRTMKLTRVRLGNLDIKDVEEGKYRFLTAGEVNQLRKLAKPECERLAKKDRGEQS